MKRAWPFLIPLLLLLLQGCVGGTLGDASEFEMFPLRSATTAEGKKLKLCLKAAHAAQEHFKKKTGHYTRKVHDLPIDKYCGDYRMAQKTTPTGYEIKAEIHEDESVVIWSVNDQGTIEEHLDPEGGSPDMEL